MASSSSNSKSEDLPNLDLDLDLSHVELDIPDYESIRQQRMDRNRKTMEAADKRITREVLPEVDQNCGEARAAVQIQRFFRGHQGRKEYTNRLFLKYQQEEKIRLEKMEHQVHEGELLVNNYNLELSLADGRTVRRNRDRRYLSQIVTIQRAWREYLKNSQTQGSRQSLSSSSSSPSSSFGVITTITIDDAKPSSPHLQSALTTATTTTTTDTSDRNHHPTGDYHHQHPHHQYSTTAKDTCIEAKSKFTTIDTTSSGIAEPEVGGIDTKASPVSSSPPGQGPLSLDSNPNPELSDHDDESSETESAIAGCAMTLLTPEENQGGGDHTPASAQRADDDTEEEETVEGGDEDSGNEGHNDDNTILQQPQHAISPPAGGTTATATAAASTSNTEGGGSNPTSDPEDISPVLPQISAPVPGIRPVLDSQEILASLEDVRAARSSPSRSSIGGPATTVSSADADAGSVASSDYSELGGPLRDLERDVAALERDPNRSAASCGHADLLCYLDDLYQSYDGSRGGGEGFFAAGGVGGRLLGIEAGLREGEEGELVQKEDETEEDFDRRVRKVNLLSLAQEFAELKKRDAQACPIDHARGVAGRRSGSLVRGGSGSPRGASLDRAAGNSNSNSGGFASRRTQSRSPGRLGIGRRAGANLTAARPVSKSPSGGRAGAMMSGSAASAAAANAAGDLPRNHEKQQQDQMMMASDGEQPDLPVNEARRRGSSADLPANMRPGRQQQKSGDSPSASAAGSGGVAGEKNESEGDGDFNVYNMESAVPEMSWDLVERHIQDRMRRESCKNDREEIRRRLAMAADEEFGEDLTPVDQSGGTGLGEIVPLMMSPRNKRLQARLQGAPSGMQICFMNDDVLDDDDDDDGGGGGGAHDYDDDLPTPGRGAEEDRLLGDSLQSESAGPPHPNHPCYAVDVQRFASRQNQLQSEATLALAQASTMARMQLEVEKQSKKKSPIADMVGIPTLGNGRRLRLSRAKLGEMSLGQLQVLVNDLHSQIELLNEDLVHLLIERDDLHMEQDSMLVDIEDLTSHCQDPAATNNNKSTQNKNRPTSRRDRHK